MHLWSIWRYLCNVVVVTCQAKCHRCTWNLKKKSQRNQNYSEILALYTRNMLEPDFGLEKSVFLPLFDSFLRDKFWILSFTYFYRMIVFILQEEKNQRKKNTKIEKKTGQKTEKKLKKGKLCWKVWAAQICPAEKSESKKNINK